MSIFVVSLSFLNLHASGARSDKSGFLNLHSGAARSGQSNPFDSFHYSPVITCAKSLAVFGVLCLDRTGTIRRDDDFRQVVRDTMRESRYWMSAVKHEGLSRGAAEVRDDAVSKASQAWKVTKQQAPVYATKALDLACEYPVWTGFGVGVTVASAAIVTGSSKGKSIVGATIPGSLAYLAADTRGVRQLASKVRSGAADVAAEAIIIKDQTTQNAARSETLTILQTATAASLAVTADMTRRVVDEASRLAPRIEAVSTLIGASADATTGASAALGSLAAEIKQVGSDAKTATAKLTELQQRQTKYSERRQVGHASVLAGLCGLQRIDEEGWQGLDAAHIKEGTALADLSKQVDAGRALLQADPRAGSSVSVIQE